MATIDYDAVLEDLRTQRDELNAAISAIERLSRGRSSSPPQGLTGNGEPVAQSSGMEEREPTTVPESKQVREDTFFGLSATAAAKKYLNMVKRPVLTQELVDALKKGGYLTNATNFYSNLYTTLKRSPEFTNLGRGKWGMSDWYPNRPRKKKSGSTVDEPDEGEDLTR